MPPMDPSAAVTVERVAHAQTIYGQWNFVEKYWTWPFMDNG